ncbi:Threonylcarbamoyl-AMP synthase [Lachnellula suecica]|uniref:Threonylcarbamoyl-AMP synthase n=1 Tax=Lachnellula suecica TaxID=602035 RepID=A0A8T9C9P1_9HELO|nr:Threonylcarbamoyl-AMP synthase [Lachnellula suecica]
MASNQANSVLSTRVLDVDTSKIGKFEDAQTLEKWELSRDTSPEDPLLLAAQHLRTKSIPVGFPTETVYGLGADATRSDAVKGIYKAKGRPSDNPLIIHVCDLTMLRQYLVPADATSSDSDRDPIPEIYKPLIKEFWPGPLTILLPNPSPSKLAPEVTAGLSTFGVRMPDSPLALSLIKLAGVPLAAPSANASTKPSPTTAAHVLHDLSGRIELILNGGSCQVGVESTVVDGLCGPPVVLRPGGVSIERIRECAGWENTVKSYKDLSEVGGSAPRAPGMKYKHYSPKAKVVLFESTGSSNNIGPLEVWRLLAARDGKLTYHGLEAATWPIKVGIVSTKNWGTWAGFHRAKWNSRTENHAAPSPTTDAAEHSDGEWDSVLVSHGSEEEPRYEPESFSSSWSQSISSKPITVRAMPSDPSSLEFEVSLGKLLQGDPLSALPAADVIRMERSRQARAASSSAVDEFQNDFLEDLGHIADLFQIKLGGETKDIAHGLFSALRELDQREVDIIYVEGIEDEGDIAAAVMNRLRKAATVIEK